MSAIFGDRVTQLTIGYGSQWSIEFLWMKFYPFLNQDNISMTHVSVVKSCLWSNDKSRQCFSFAVTLSQTLWNDEVSRVYINQSSKGAHWLKL